MCFSLALVSARKLGLGGRQLKSPGSALILLRLLSISLSQRWAGSVPAAASSRQMLWSPVPSLYGDRKLGGLVLLSPDLLEDVTTTDRQGWGCALVLSMDSGSSAGRVSRMAS